jgi:hypothetical protein
VGTSLGTGRGSGGRLLANEIIPLVVGFVLTTVLGGLLGSWLQQSIWKRQNDMQLRQEELRHADNACQQVSKLLDKRLYRMRRLYSALESDAGRPGRNERIQACLKEHDEVLYEWNDGLNLNLALMGAYFGTGARNWLHSRIYEQFERVDAQLANYHNSRAQRDPALHSLPEASLAGIRTDIDLLGGQVYQLGAFMMTQIRDGDVGRKAPAPLHVSPSPGEVHLPALPRTPDQP